MIVTIDGSAGTGKSTVARQVAEKLHFAYFDTGAMYRAVAWTILEEKISLSDLPRIEKLMKHFSFYIKEEGNQKRYFAQDIDVTEAIRTQRVTGIVSQIAAIAPVREALTIVQRGFASKGDSVFEGRDMGTVVFPHAEIKIFLTARPEVRAQRRYDELVLKMPEEVKHLDREHILKDLLRRDEIDSTRALSPLRCPKDAYTIDTSDLSIDQVVAAILQYVHKKFPHIKR